jgi:hypothetical protein
VCGAHSGSEVEQYIGLGNGKFISLFSEYYKVRPEFESDQIYHRRCKAMDMGGNFVWVVIDVCDDVLGKINWGLEEIATNCFVDGFNRLWINHDVNSGDELFCDYGRKREYTQFLQASTITCMEEYCIFHIHFSSPPLTKLVLIILKPALIRLSKLCPLCEKDA